MSRPLAKCKKEYPATIKGMSNSEFWAEFLDAYSPGIRDNCSKDHELEFQVDSDLKELESRLPKLGFFC